MPTKTKNTRKKPPAKPKKKKAYKNTKKRVARRKKKAFDVKLDTPVYSYTTLVRRYITGGQPRKYLPGELLEVFAEYVESVENSPLHEDKVFANGERTHVRHIRAMSIQAFCLFARMHRDTFNQYGKEVVYSDVIAFIRQTMYAQKFEGAACGMLKESIIMRDLDFVAKTSIVDDDGNAILGWNYLPPQEPTTEI